MDTNKYLYETIVLFIVSVIIFFLLLASAIKNKKKADKERAVSKIKEYEIK